MQKKTSGKINSTSLNKSVFGIRNTVSKTYKAPFTFKGRKSPNIIEGVLNQFTSDGDNVLDPFMGTATTLVASQNSKHNLFFTGVELDNYTYFIDKILFEKIDDDKLNKVFQIVATDCEQKVMDLYKTKCHNKTNYIKRIYFDREPDGKSAKDGYFHPETNRDIKNGCNVVLVNNCSVCGKNRKKFSNYDWKKIQSLNKIKVSDFPQDDLLENSRINITKSTGANKFDRIFTHRNQLALMIIQHSISNLPNSKEKDYLQNVLVSTLKLARVSMYGSSTDILYHVVKKKCQDSNVWILLKNQLSAFKKFKETYPKSQADNFDKNKKYINYLGDYYDILQKKLPEKKFDLIFTDFPYSDQVPYLERNQLFRVWMHHFSSHSDDYDFSKYMLEKEMVVSNSPSRKDKDLVEFYNSLDKMFSTFADHLNSGNSVIIFSKFDGRRYLQNFSTVVQTARKNGFELTGQVSVVKDDPTLRKQSAYRNTPTNEVLIAFERLNPDDEYFSFIDKDTNQIVLYDDVVDRYVYQSIKNNKNHEAFLPDLLNYFENDLKKYDIFADKAILEKIRRIINTDFRINKNQSVFLSYENLYVDLEDKHSLVLKLIDWIPSFIKELLKEHNGKFVLEDLFIKLIDKFSSGSSSTISELLDSSTSIDEIKQVLEMHCDVDGDYYVERQLPQIIKNDAIDIMKVDPYDFEKICVDLLTKKGYLNTQEIGGSGDFGVDIISEKMEGNSSSYYLIQCKRWLSNVGSQPIQRLHSELIRLNADKAICISTSNYTKDGLKAAHDNNIQIINGEDLMKMLDFFYPGKYYNSLYY